MKIIVPQAITVREKARQIQQRAVKDQINYINMNIQKKTFKLGESFYNDNYN